MTRHGKNCTANSVYTYHERKKDALRSGYGTQEVRLGKDSIKAPDCCCLSLQPARDPVITRDGFLYDKTVILEYILQQRSEIERKLKIYKKQLSQAETVKRAQTKATKDEEARKFLSLNTMETHSKISKPSSSSESSTSSFSKRNGLLPDSLQAASFWTHSPASSVSSTEPMKPDTIVRCPMSGKPLKFKDLVPVKFVKVPDATVSSATQYCCAVSKDSITNATACVVLRPSGFVVTKQVADNIIRRDMVDPTDGSKLVESDLIDMQRGSLGFADERAILVAKRSRPCMQT